MNDNIFDVLDGLLGTLTAVRVAENNAEVAPFLNDLKKARVKRDLSMRGISVRWAGEDSDILLTRIGSAESGVDTDDTTPTARPQPQRHTHSYVPPKMAGPVMDALLDEASHVLWFKGPTGTGKSMLARYVARELGRELYQINCHADIGAESLFGEQTVEVDEETGQNHVVFRDGPVVQAMQCGLDADGNEVGDAGLLFVDEAGAMSPQVAIALNRLLEGDHARRKVTLELDGGREVVSHSQFRVILAANTAGRGATSMAEAAYTAQTDALDLSLLNRVTMTFRFGYDRSVEKQIAMEKLGDDKVMMSLMKFRDAVRDNIRAGRLSTPFSTRAIVNLCNAYRIFGSFSQALQYTVLEQLLPEERAVYLELATAQLGIEPSQSDDTDIDYM